MTPLDAIDRKILSCLQTDGRMTMQELADKVGLSVSPCHRRVKLLEEWDCSGLLAQLPQVAVPDQGLAPFRGTVKRRPRADQMRRQQVRQ